MNHLDDLLYAKICHYLSLVNCSSTDITNLMITSSSIREMVKQNVNIQKHRVVTFTRPNSKIKWVSDPICLTCHRIKDYDFNELVRIRNVFSNIHLGMKYNGSKSSIFIHRDTQSELETFLVKLAKLTKNVVVTRNYCCRGKGVEIDLS
jgi:hypothetical protein